MSEKNKSIEGLRAVACLLVLIHHTMQVPLLWWGVDVFFVIAGFLNTKSVLSKVDKAKNSTNNERAGSKNFALKKYYLFRLIRIVPAYYIAILLVYLYNPNAFPENSLLSYLTFTNNIFDVTFSLHSLDALEVGPFWSIAVEMQFYFLWPLFLAYFTNYGSNIKACRWMTLLLILIPFLLRGLIHSFLPDISFYANYTTLPCRFDLLALGAILAMPKAFKVNARKITPYALLNVLAFALLTIYHPDFKSPTGFGFPDSLSFITFGFSSLAFTAFYLVAVVLEKDFCSLLKRFLKIETLVWLGALSYVIYLTQGIVIISLKKAGIHSLFTLIFGLPPLIAIAWVVNTFVEKPLAKLKKSF